MTTIVTQGKWFPTGNDFIIDGLWGRLGVQESFGETRISGATNGLAAIDKPDSGQTFLYAGSVNGGLYLRTYDQAKDRWSKTWTWLTKPEPRYRAGVLGKYARLVSSSSKGAVTDQAELTANR